MTTTGRAQQFDDVVCLIAGMDRRTIALNLRTFRGRFPVDLTPDFIASTDLDRLRHIYLALCLQTRQMPTFATARDESDQVEQFLEKVA